MAWRTTELGPIKGQLKETLRELTALDGVAGQEMAVVRWLKERFAPLADEVVVDRMGNVLATKRGGRGRTSSSPPTRTRSAGSSRRSSRTARSASPRMAA